MLLALNVRRSGRAWLRKTGVRVESGSPLQNESGGRYGIEIIYHYGLFLTGLPLLLLVGLTVFTLASLGRIREANRRGGVSESGRQYTLRLRRRCGYLWAASFVSWSAFVWCLAGFVGAFG